MLKNNLIETSSVRFQEMASFTELMICKVRSNVMHSASKALTKSTGSHKLQSISIPTVFRGNSIVRVQGERIQLTAGSNRPLTRRSGS